MEIYSHVRTPQQLHTTSNGSQTSRGNTNTNSKKNTHKSIHNNDNPESGTKLIQTLTACYRCRQRKTKCDVGLPKCGPCQRARPAVDCKFWDADREHFVSRTYIVNLQQKVQELELEYRRRTVSKEDKGPPKVEDLVRSMGLVSLADEEPEPHYLGSSAGLQLARLVVEFAKERTRNHSVEDIVPSSEHESAKQQGKERRPSFPALSAQPMGKLPNQTVAVRLIEEFIFKRDDVYAGSQDSYQNFAFKIVVAISMQKLGSQYSALADSYYLAALLHLEDVISLMNLDTLQCFCLMGQYSLLTPTRTGIYHIIGLATRLCIDLGLHQEITIKQDKTGVPYDPLTLDMRRRLFWVTMSMESGLSHILGRPSGFCTGDYFTDVEFYQPVDDIYITRERVMPGPQSMKKLMSMHFFRMRILQAEIRRTLYQNRRPSPTSDSDPWFKEMYAKLDSWVKYAPQNDQGLGLSRKWFQHRYNNMLIFLYRPSPQIPEPSLEATILCYNCAIENIALQKKMFVEKTSDLTWVLVHQVYMTCIIMMWCLSCKRIRELHSKDEVGEHIQTGMECLDFLVERWPGVGSAKEIFWRLSRVALQSYDHDTDIPYFKQTIPNYEPFQHPDTQSESQNENDYATSPASFPHAALSHSSPGSVNHYPSSPPMTPDTKAYHSPEGYALPSPHTSPAMTNATFASQYQDSTVTQSSPPPPPPPSVIRSSFRHSYQGDPIYASDQSFPTYAESIDSISSRHPSMVIRQSTSSPMPSGNVSSENIHPSSDPTLSNYQMGAYSMASAPNVQAQQPINLTRSPSLAPHETMLNINNDMNAHTQSQSNLSIPALTTSAPAINSNSIAYTQAPSYPDFPNPFYTISHPGYQVFNNGMSNPLNYSTQQALDNISTMYGTYNADLLQQDQVNDLMDTLESDSQNNFPTVASNPFAVFY